MHASHLPKRLSLFFLLLLTSFRLVASAAGMGLGNSDASLPQKALLSAHHGAIPSECFLSETDPVEENEEEFGEHEGFDFAVLPSPAAWFGSFFSPSLPPRLVIDFGVVRSAQPLFVLFRNFRI